ncbi:hypothetical protein Syun_020838 [Stephania yunnanensis]|uniref:Uncharacterized protein n=1 Tax=Stephania yunnanensis TaxID=152371 RepID=A0AAP0NRS5_9MAGN
MSGPGFLPALAPPPVIALHFGKPEHSLYLLELMLILILPYVTSTGSDPHEWCNDCPAVSDYSLNFKGQFEEGPYQVSWGSAQSKVLSIIVEVAAFFNATRKPEVVGFREIDLGHIWGEWSEGRDLLVQSRSIMQERALALEATF